MPRVIVPVTAIARTGVVNGSTGTEVTGDSTNHHYFTNNERTFLHARNSDASSHNITLKIGKSVDGQTPTGAVIAVPANSQKLIGPFSNADYMQPTDPPNVYFDVDSTLLRLQAFSI